MTTGNIWHNQTIGNGPQSVLWLHGWGYDKQGFSKVAAQFTAESRNQLFDLPGFGQTPMLFEGAGTADYADALAGQLDDKDKHIIVGHSYGGRIAVQFAAKYPSRVRAIILVGGAGLPRKRSIGFKIKALALKLLGRVTRLSDKVFGTRLRERYVARFGSADYKNAGDLRATLVSAVNENLSIKARQVACPALLLYGEKDTDTPPEIGRRYEQLIPVSRFVQLKGYDHHDILTRGAYQCEAMIKSFLKDLRDD